MTVHSRLVRRFGLVGVLALVGVGVVACGSPKHAASAGSTTASTGPAASGSSSQWQSVLAAANKEGEVTVYDLDSTAEQGTVKNAWAKDYPGIKLNFDRLSPAEIEARVTAELASGVQGDVIQSADPPFVQGLDSKGELVKPVGPSFSDPKWTAKDLSVTPDDYAIEGSAWCLAWNTKLVPNGLSSLDDYLKLKPGLMGLEDPAASPPNLAPYYLSLDKAAGYDFLAKLAAANLKPRIYPGGNPEAAALAAGEIGAALGPTVGQVEQEKAAGAPVAYKLYNGVFVVNSNMMILKGAPHPNAAQVFSNWIVSHDGQQALADGQAPLVYRTDVKSNTDLTGVTVIPSKPLPQAQVTAFVNQFNKWFK